MLFGEAEEAALKMFDEMYEERNENFGNGRDVRNCFEDMVVRQSNRVAAMENPSKDDLIAVLPEDLMEPEDLPEQPAEAEPEAENTEPDTAGAKPEAADAEPEKEN